MGLSSLVDNEPEELEIEGEAGEKADNNVEEEGWDDLILEDRIRWLKVILVLYLYFSYLSHSLGQG